MALFGGLIGRLIGVAVLLLALLLLGGLAAYAADTAIEATVTDKSCAFSGGEVTVKTKVGGIEHVAEVGGQECFVVQNGNFVKYHIRTERTIIYESEGGDCIWDTKAGAIC